MMAVPKPQRPVRGTKACRQHMARVAQLPCCVCGHPGPSIGHHVCHDRYSQSRASDLDTIPLCAAHHDATSPVGLHHAPAAWRARHGADHGYLPAVRAAIHALEGDAE